jgi:death-on-curing protein
MLHQYEFLLLQEVLSIHRQGLDRYGGQDGIRDLGVIESAIAQPQQGFGGALLHSDIFEMAAAYAFHISEAQGFLDGNKRAGLGACLVFLQLNGFVIPDHANLKLYEALNERWSKMRIAALLRWLLGG